MSEGFRVAECLYSPSHLYSIYDYTKIAYLTGHHICVRQVYSPDTPPSFIPLEARIQPHRLLALFAFPNCLLLAERLPTDLLLHFHSQNSTHTCRVPSELLKKCESPPHVQCRLHHSSAYVYFLLTASTDNEIVVVDYKRRQVVGRGFVSGAVLEFKLKWVEEMELFSLLLPGEVLEFEVVRVKCEEAPVRLLQRKQITLPLLASGKMHHCWSRQELILKEERRITVLVDQKEIQHIDFPSQILQLKSTIAGFIVVSRDSLAIYKKNSSVYDLISKQHLTRSPHNLMLSPQEDLLAYYCLQNQAIYYAFEYQGSSKEGRLKAKSIKHNAQRIALHPSRQPLFVVSNHSLLRVFSATNYQPYLATLMRSQPTSTKISESKGLTRTLSLYVNPQPQGEGQEIVAVGLHPTQPILAVAFKSVVRVYMVLYNQLKVGKEILIANVKEVGFSNSGSVFYVKVSGRQGSKLYLYAANQKYEQVQVLFASRPLRQVLFSRLDSVVYGVHQDGFYSWNADQVFKQRNQHVLPFQATGADITTQGMVLWGERQLAMIQCGGTTTVYALPKPINHLIVQGQHFILMTAEGYLYQSPALPSIPALLDTQGFRLGQGTLTPVGSNGILFKTPQGNILCLEWGAQEKHPTEVVSLERKRIAKYQTEYLKYQQMIGDIEQEMGRRLQALRDEFLRREEQQRAQFLEELREREKQWVTVRDEKMKIEQSIDQNLEIREQEVLQNVKDLQRMYERKMAITMNKLLTSEQMAFRNSQIAKQNLHQLQAKHSQDIARARHQYSTSLQSQLNLHNPTEQLLSLKQHYQTRMSQLQIQNQFLLRHFQQQSQTHITSLKKTVVNLELKYSEAVSQKYNLEKEYQEERMQLGMLRERVEYLEGRLGEEVRRGEQLGGERNQMENLLCQKEAATACLEKRVAELEKANQIFKYRIVEMKATSDPKEEEIIRLKEKMIELEQQNDKITMHAHEMEQVSNVAKKESKQLRQASVVAKEKATKIDKNYGVVIDRVREATKAPIQEIRKLLLKLLDTLEKPTSQEGHERRSESPLAELNRIRDHLEVCFHEAVETNKRTQKQKQIQVSRKNHQNSELLSEINGLRTMNRELQNKLKHSQLRVQEMEREVPSQKKLRYQQNSTKFESESQITKRNKTRESFFQKSMFKSNWGGRRRLRTQGGSRKKSVHSLARNEGHLQIERGEDPQQLRRLLEQKQAIIKQLINKIHRLS